MKLDSVLTVAIGRNRPNGKPMGAEKWRLFGWEVYNLLNEYGKIVAFTAGEGVTSDHVSDGEETKVYVVINANGDGLLRARLGRLLSRYGQTSAAFALDPFHDPVWATSDGSRPDHYDKKVVSAMKDSEPIKVGPDRSTSYQHLATPSTAASYDTQPGWLRERYSVKNVTL